MRTCPRPRLITKLAPPVPLLGALLIIASIITLLLPKHASGGALRGIWISDVGSEDYASPERIDAAVARARSLGLEAVYPCVWNKGRAFFRSPTMEELFDRSVTRPYGDRDILAEFVAAGRRHGIAIVPWFEDGLKVPLGIERNGRLLGTHLGVVLGRKGWLTCDARGRVGLPPQWGVQKGFLNPAHRGVRRFLTTVFSEIMRYDVAGIMVDDHFSLAADFGHDTIMVARFEGRESNDEDFLPETDEPGQAQDEDSLSETDEPGQAQDEDSPSETDEPGETSSVDGERVPSFDALAIMARPAGGEDPVGRHVPLDAHGDFHAFRCRVVADAIAELAAVVRARGGRFVLCPGGAIGFSRKIWLQDWLLLARGRLVDEIIVQVYRRDLDSFRKSIDDPSLAEAARLLPFGVAVLTGLKAKPDMPASQILGQTRILLDRGWSPSYFWHEMLDRPATLVGETVVMRRTGLAALADLLARTRR